MSDRFFIGLMSGTSVDGIDAALVRIGRSRAGGYSAKVVRHVEHAWPARIRRRLLGVMAPANTTTQEICQLNVLVAREFAAAAEKVIRAAGVARRKIAAIGSHGQTVCHLPPGGRDRAITASTLQLGDASVLATLTGMTVVGNFRPADMAVGGQGAPLVPFADAALLTHATKSRTVQNIGGIANVTYLPRGRDGGDVIAFDTGPGNMLLDAVVTLGGKGRYDKNGRLAAKGQLSTNLFRVLQAHDYFTRRPPKSTGREEFGGQLARMLVEQQRKRGGRLEDLVHTLTRLTAWSIADAYLHFLPEIPDEAILCGGGADNPVLVRMLTEELASLRSEYTHPEPPAVRRIDEFGIPNKAKEAASFAVLAAATLDGVAGNLPSVTGASRGVVLGVIAPRGNR